MNDDLTDDLQLAGGIFPFLSVLFCTIGVLVVIWVAGALKYRLRGGDKKARAAREMREGLLVNIDQLQQKRTDLSKLVAQVDLDLTQVKKKLARAEETEQRYRASLSALRKKIRLARSEQTARQSQLRTIRAEAEHTRDIPAKMDVYLAWKQARERQQRLAEARKALQKEIAGADEASKRLDEEVAALRKRRDRLQKEAQTAQVRLDVRGLPPGTKPVFVELTPDAVRIHGDGVPVPAGAPIAPDRATAPNGAFQRLAAALARPGSDRVAIFLLRPGTDAMFRYAAGAFNRSRAPLAKEPLETTWKLVLGDAADSPAAPPAPAKAAP